jgi:hypothetical protein
MKVGGTAVAFAAVAAAAAPTPSRVAAVPVAAAAPKTAAPPKGPPPLPKAKPNPASDFKYNLANDGGIKIVSFLGDKKSVRKIVIPDQIEGIPVTVIGEKIFEHYNNLTTVIISDSVVTIGGDAFRECSNLTTIKIPDSVMTIGAAAFHNNQNLAIVEMPEHPIEYPDAKEHFFLFNNGREMVYYGDAFTFIEDGVPMAVNPDYLAIIESKEFKSGCEHIFGSADAFSACPKLTMQSKSKIKRTGYKHDFD